MAKNVTYENLMAQIANLTKKAEAVRNNEKSFVIADIQKKIKNFGINANELGLATMEKIKHTRKKPTAKYKDPITGAVWTGRGKIPKWMKPALEQGKTREHFAI